MADRAQEFYGAVFGWTFTSAGPDYGGYVDIAKDGHPMAGMMRNDPDWQMAPSDVAGPATSPGRWSACGSPPGMAASPTT